MNTTMMMIPSLAMAVFLFGLGKKLRFAHWVIGVSIAVTFAVNLANPNNAILALVVLFVLAPMFIRLTPPIRKLQAFTVTLALVNVYSVISLLFSH